MFITVLATLVVNTVISKGPIIFLSLNQEKTGEFDSLVIPSDDFRNDLNYQCDWEKYFNYTRVIELYGTEKFNVAPRYH